MLAIMRSSSEWYEITQILPGLAQAALQASALQNLKLVVLLQYGVAGILGGMSAVTTAAELLRDPTQQASVVWMGLLALYNASCNT